MLKKIFNRQVIGGILFITILFLLHYYKCTQYLTVQCLQENICGINDFMCHHYIASVLIFMAAYCLATTLAIPGASIFSMSSGLFFGVIPGVFYSVIAGTLGATLLFLIARYILGGWFQQKFATRLVRFNQEVEQYGILYLIVVRFIAVIPFFIVNILSGLTLVPVKTFIWTTALGMIPTTLIFAYAGKQLATAESLTSILKSPIISGFLLVMAFKVLLLPIVIKMRNRRIKK